MLVGQDWVDNHFETFIRGNLGKLPTLGKGKYSYVGEFRPDRHIGILLAIWKQAKLLCKHQPMLLAGRDVFLLELLARLEGYPTTFRRDISSYTHKYVKENYKDHFLVDTGYRGTIPTSLGMSQWVLINYDPYPKLSKTDTDQHQLFPKARPYTSVRGMASKLEGSPKYWTHGEYKEGRIQQRLSDEPTFTNAALLTMHILKHVPIPKKRRPVVQSVGRGI